MLLGTRPWLILRTVVDEDGTPGFAEAMQVRSNVLSNVPLNASFACSAQWLAAEIGSAGHGVIGMATRATNSAGRVLRALGPTSINIEGWMEF